MVTKLISKKVIGILILLVMGVMVWQVAPVSAGVTPTPTPTSPPAATATPTAKSRPQKTETPIPPTAVPTATPPVLLPVTGGSESGPNNIEINAVSLVGMLVILLVAISLVIRKSARTKTNN